MNTFAYIGHASLVCRHVVLTLCYYAIFFKDPVTTTRTNYIILLHTDVIATVEITVKV